MGAPHQVLAWGGVLWCAVFFHCGGKTKVVPDAAPASVVTAKLIRDLDILFVIDNTVSNGVQEPLVRGFASFSEGLGVPNGASPNLQIGVVSTDVGAGNYGINGCEGDGDAGGLQPKAMSCSTRARFIENRGLRDGSRLINYDESLEQTFACMARLGSNGCGFEQPLASMQRALNGSHPDNDGFPRKDAMLAVILVADEDDCSVHDTAVFDNDPLLDSAGSGLGFFSSFRCFEFGVQCEPDEPRVAGTKANCTSRDDSPYLVAPSEYATWLRTLKEREDMVLGYGFSGGTEPVVVGLSNQEPFLEASCSGIHGISPPGIRLDAFLQSLSGRAAYSKCQDDYGQSLAGIAESITESMASVACLSGPLRDSQPETDGMQPICEVVDVANLNQPSEQRQPLSWCADVSALPCYRFEPAEARCGAGGMALSVDREEQDTSGNALTTFAHCEGL